MKPPFFHLLVIAVLGLIACRDRGNPHSGDLAKEGGSATVRLGYERLEDDPSTTNDESNDQPLGHFGAVTLEITSHDSGNTYTLDAEADGTTIERVYFPKGGWIDFYSCEVDEDLNGDCEDEEGRWWTIEGESSWSASGWVQEEETEDDGISNNLEEEFDTDDDSLADFSFDGLDEN